MSAEAIADAIRESSQVGWLQNFADLGTGVGGLLTAAGVGVAVVTFRKSVTDRREDAAHVLHVLSASEATSFNTRSYTVIVRNVGQRAAVVESILPDSPWAFLSETNQGAFMLNPGDEQIATVSVQSLWGNDPRLQVTYACMGLRWVVPVEGGKPVQVK